jgi:RNA polymerase sigma factor (TIGR02999 family)
MSEVTRILKSIEDGDPTATEDLLPLIYEELRKLAAQRMAQENPGQTLSATALVHEAYIRLVDVEKVKHWDSRGHFFAAAAEAMRRILVDNARRKQAQVHGGDRQRIDLGDADLVSRATPDKIVALDEALSQLATEDAKAADLVKLRVFAGISIEEAAEALSISRATAYRRWTYARAWLRAELGDSSESDNS